MQDDVGKNEVCERPLRTDRVKDGLVLGVDLQNYEQEQPG